MRARGRAQLPDAVARRRSSRRRIVGISSGSIARRAHGVGSAARTRAISFPSRWQRRLGGRTARGRDRRRAVGANESGILRALRAVFNRGSLERCAVVSRPRSRALEIGHPRTCDARRPSARQSAHRHPDFACADFLEIFLPRQPHQLSDVLSDRTLRDLRARRAAPSLRIRRGDCRGNDRRWPARRSLRTQIRHLVFDPRRVSVRPVPSVCESLLERAAHDRYRNDHRFSVPGDRRVRAGSLTGQGRDGLGALFRVRLRNRGRRRGVPRAACRCRRHRDGL